MQSLHDDGPVIDSGGAGSSMPLLSTLPAPESTQDPAAPEGSATPGGSASGLTGVSVGSSAPTHVPPQICKGVIQPVNYMHITKFGLACSTGEPNTFEEALGDEHWIKAMEEEHVALQKNKT